MNIKGLGDFKKEDKDKKKTTQSYTGGQKSGMAVLNPDVNSIMQKAQKNSKTPEQFEKQQKMKDGNVVKITLYQNGFSVDDGEFRNYQDPENKQFMKQLNKGYVPKQLKKKYPTGGVSVSLSDKTSEKYVPPPPPPYIAFSGSGYNLSEPKKQASKFSKKSKAQQNFILQPNKNKEITTMRVRLANGTSITMQANLDSSLQDVYNHIATVSGVNNFDLVGGFPPKALDLSSTVQKSDLADGTLIQKG